MGGLSSKNSNGNFDGNDHVLYHNKAFVVVGGGGDSGGGSEVKGSNVLVGLQQETEEKHPEGPFSFPVANEVDDDVDDYDIYYDGIPCYPCLKSRSSSSIAAKVSSRLGRAGNLGLGIAVELLDRFGSSMTNLNPNTRFSSGVATKGNELQIFAFEAANTIVKGSKLMQSVSKRSIQHLREVVFPSEGVQSLISTDMDELLRIVAADKREELKIFLREVVRFGNRCKDPQWHNLDRYFDKIGGDLILERKIKEKAESVIGLLMSIVQYTADLYNELQMLDRLEQEYQNRGQQDSTALNNNGGSLAFLRAEIKIQRKLVKNLKKKSLWSRSMEEVMENLVNIVHILLMEINNTFGTVDGNETVTKPVRNHRRLGSLGLSLHFANVVMQINALVVRSRSINPKRRDSLYQRLPPGIKSALRPKLQTFHVKEEFTVTGIKEEMKKTMQWLLPMATNTAKAHHGFGWVGEWANTRSDVNRQPDATSANVIWIETLYHADQKKTEAYLLELVLWLHNLVSKSKTVAKVGGVTSFIKSPLSTLLGKSDQQPVKSSTSMSLLTPEDQKMLEDSSKKKGFPGKSKSHDFDFEKKRLRKHDRLSASANQSPRRENNESFAVKRLPSVIPIISFGVDKEKALDVIDRVDVFR